MQGLGVADLAKRVDAVGDFVAQTYRVRAMDRFLGADYMADLDLDTSGAANCPLCCPALAVGQSVDYQLRLLFKIIAPAVAPCTKSATVIMRRRARLAVLNTALRVWLPRLKQQLGREAEAAGGAGCATRCARATAAVAATAAFLEALVARAKWIQFDDEHREVFVQQREAAGVRSKEIKRLWKQHLVEHLGDSTEPDPVQARDWPIGLQLHSANQELDTHWKFDQQASAKDQKKRLAGLKRAHKACTAVVGETDDPEASGAEDEVRTVVAKLANVISHAKTVLRGNGAVPALPHDLLQQPRLPGAVPVLPLELCATCRQPFDVIDACGQAAATHPSAIKREEYVQQMAVHKGHLERALGHLMRDAHLSCAFTRARTASVTATHAYIVIDYKLKVRCNLHSQFAVIACLLTVERARVCPQFASAKQRETQYVPLWRVCVRG